MSKQTNNNFLGQEKIGKLLIKFAVPCIFSLLISSLYNIVDQIFIGNSELGYLGNAATTVVFPITIVAVAFAWCFGDGCAAFLSLCQGRKDTKDVHKSIANSILATIIISIVFVIVGFVGMDNILRLFGASDTSIGLARDYFTIILVFIPVYMLANVMNPIIRADGSPKVSMASTVTGAVANIILDPIFIFGFGLGIKGAAWATIIGQVLSLVIAILYFLKPKTFHLSLPSFKPNWIIFKNVIKLGISTFITQMSIVVISVVCNATLLRYGSESIYGADIPIAVIGIAMKVFTIVINIVVGIALGAQPILGFNYGAKNYDRVKQTCRSVLIPTALIGIIATFFFEFTPESIISWFGTGDTLYLEFATKTFRVFLSLVTLTSLIKVTSIMLQSVGKPVKAAIVSLSRDIVLFVPIVLILPNFMGIDGALYAAPLADICGAIITSTLFISFIRSLKTSPTTSDQPAVIADSSAGWIIAISREHGSQGKKIGELVAKQLGIPYYHKELIALAASESGIAQEFLTEDESPSNLFLGTEPRKYAIEAQDKVIKQIAKKGACVIVGRAADYVLREHKNLLRVFVYAPHNYRVKRIMEMYGDTKKSAEKNLERSDKARANYYETISGQKWKDVDNYDLLVDSSIGVNGAADVICSYVANLKHKK